ncbi:hypothetical protein OCAR_7015 [Afipia carboxidovorans OM5]|nr:hypothetical protein OCAR_7015 [Afipia carboxidovorans OM5]
MHRDQKACEGHQAGIEGTSSLNMLCYNITIKRIRVSRVAAQ